MNIINDLGDVYTSVNGFAQLLGLTQPRVSQLIRDGVIEKDKKSKIHVVSAMKKYLEFRLQDKTENPYNDERTQMMRAKRRMLELEIAEKEKRLHEASAVEYEMGKMLGHTRNTLLGYPATLIPLLEGKKKSQMLEIMQESVNDLLDTLRDYDAELFKGVGENEEDS